MIEKMTFVLTSCGRPELLNKTLQTFFKYNKYAFHELYLVEDSVDKNVYEKIQKNWGKKLKILFNIKKKDKLGQLSIHINLLKHL